MADERNQPGGQRPLHRKHFPDMPLHIYRHPIGGSNVAAKNPDQDHEIEDRARTRSRGT